MKPAVFAIVFAVAAALAPLAAAGDIQGDAYDCNELWRMRNAMFKEAGYCFKSPRAIALFGNAGCRFDSDADVPFSDNQRAVLSDIKRSEKRQACGA